MLRSSAFDFAVFIIAVMIFSLGLVFYIEDSLLVKICLIVFQAFFFVCGYYYSKGNQLKPSWSLVHSKNLENMNKVVGCLFVNQKITLLEDDVFDVLGIENTANYILEKTNKSRQYIVFNMKDDQEKLFVEMIQNKLNLLTGDSIEKVELYNGERVAEGFRILRIKKNSLSNVESITGSNELKVSFANYNEVLSNKFDLSELSSESFVVLKNVSAVSDYFFLERISRIGNYSEAEEHEKRVA